MEEDIRKKTLSGVDRLLLAPGYFVFEIMAILLPGVVFLALLVLKGEYYALLMLNSAALGYKTKLALGLVFSYLIGKILETPGANFERIASSRHAKKSGNADQPMAQKEITKTFLTGVFFLPGLFSRSHALDYLVLARTQHFFSTGCGSALMLASVFPGDGNLRIVELVIGSLFVLRGYVGIQAAPVFASTMLGLSMTGEFEKLAPKGLLSLLPTLAHLMRDTSPLPVAPAPAPETKSEHPNQSGQLPEKSGTEPPRV
jgi:hypothetical protein